MGRGLLLSLCCLSLAVQCFCQLQINAVGANYQITFDATLAGVSNGAFAGSGFAPNPAVGQLDSDAWKITRISNSPIGLPSNVVTSNYGDTNTIGDFALGIASVPVSTGGIYAFSGTGLSGRAMGFQPSADAFSGTLGSSVELRCVNNTGQTLTNVLLTYRLYIRNDEDRSSLAKVSINQDFFAPYTNLTKLDLPTLDVTSPLTATPPPPPPSTAPVGWTTNLKNFPASGLCIRPGEYFYVTWTIVDNGGSGSRDEFALDNINIRATAGTADITFYTQNTGEQLGTPGSTMKWSTVPDGNVTFGMYPFIPEADYVVQSGHIMTQKGSGADFTMDDLLVEAGATLIADKPGTETNLVRYLTLFGDITCDGTIGSNLPSTYPGAGIGFNLEPGSHAISGSGTFDASRIRKSDANLLDGVCDLSFDMDVGLHFPGNALYNDRNAGGGGTNYFNVTVNPGVTVTVDRDMGVDGTNPDSGDGVERGGSFEILGTLAVAQTFRMRTDNTGIPVAVNVRSGGTLRAATITRAASGSAGHSLLIEGGALLDITGSAWQNYSANNNAYTFDPGSSVRYSGNNSQNVLNQLEYQNLILQGTGGTGNRTPTGSASQLTIREDLTISGNAKLNPGSGTVLINGSWNSYGQAGFTEGTSLVVFENLNPGESIINTNGGELFNDLEIRSGTTVMNSDVEVLNVFDLNAILDLNAQNLAIRSPANMAPVNGSAFEMVISEDTGHLGSMSVNIGTYAVPVEFPFGTDGGEPIYCRFALNGGNAGEVTMATYGTGSNNLPRPVFPEAVNNLIGDLGTVADNANATVDRFWSITTTGSTVDANISLSFLQSEMPTSSPYDDVSLIRAQRYDGSLDRWQPSLPGQVVIQDSPIVGVHRIDVPNVTDFSPWAAAAEGSPLPVELLSFKGSIENGGIALEWSTASEINNSHFILSRFGEDGISKEIATVAGEGNSSSVVNYEWLDSEPLDGLNYYQLTQVDFDGTATDEGTVVVLWKVGSGLAVLAQSWGQDGLYLLTQSRSERLFLEIFDMNGRLLHQSHLSSGQSVTRYTPVHSGIYLARLTDGEDILSIKLPFKAQ